MTIEQQAEKLIDEAYGYAPSSGYMQEKFAIEIAIWCATQILGSVDKSNLDSLEYWANVLLLLHKEKRKQEYK